MLELVDTPVIEPSTETCAVRLADSIFSLYCVTGFATVPPAVLTGTKGTAATIGSWNAEL